MPCAFKAIVGNGVPVGPSQQIERVYELEQKAKYRLVRMYHRNRGEETGNSQPRRNR